ncbi:nuclease-related domain-containing DEAD/DEAH box helicase [Lysinibacillus sp. JNUCC-52]|uniref:nuclease-related domain-containing DEAD/DEAH box helicase n=1 Tax=Lysinibacillus sp. JNUCC-52 TaxID=2792480 RepID=UPI001935735F|nr:NERD domain-containing protein [Lysinibacillus sp. JNUCC-52]
MAVFIPNDRVIEEFNRSIGEQQIYQAFESLSDDYYIFHSIRWTDASKDYPRFGESDFTIFNPKYGVLCIEVKHGGIFSENGRIYQVNTSNNLIKEIKPMFQADRSKYFFADLLKEKMSDIASNYYVHSVVWFSHINRSDLVGELPHEYYINGNVFFKDDIQNIEKTLLNCFEFFKINKRSYTEDEQKMVINSLSPNFSAFPSMIGLFEQAEYVFNRMTNEQLYLLDYLEEQKIAAIQGGAGTGKTMLAVEKARRLSSNESVLFLCYNKLLVEHLQKIYQHEFPNITFTNLNTLASRALNKIVDSHDIKFFLEKFVKYPDLWNYKSIIIDEGQDFDENHLSLLKSIIELNEGSFYIFYDKNQLVQQRNGLSWVKDIECRLVLTLNCRNTLSIAETSSKAIGVDKVKMRLEVLGDKPTLKNFEDRESLLAEISNQIRFYLQNGITLDQIVILTTKTIERSILNDLSKVGDYYISNEIEGGKLLFTTARKFKGLESNIIIIVDVDSDTFSTEENRRVFYVAASRAKNIMHIYTCLLDKQLKELFSTVSNGGTNTKISLVKNLGIKCI